MIDRSVWGKFTQDPRNPQVGHLRASDRDRDVVRDVLAAAFAEGRLMPDELDERIDRLTVVRTLGELPPLIDDLVPRAGLAILPQDLRREAERRYRQQRQQAFYGFLTPTLICWAVYAATMLGGFPWPILVTIATALPLLRLVAARLESIEHIEHDLAHKERKRQEHLERRRRRGLPPPRY